MSFLEEATSFSLKCINIIEYQQLSVPIFYLDLTMRKNLYAIFNNKSMAFNLVFCRMISVQLFWKQFFKIASPLHLHFKIWKKTFANVNNLKLSPLTIFIFFTQPKQPLKTNKRNMFPFNKSFECFFTKKFTCHFVLF